MKTISKMRKYALNNSYFKNRRENDPDTLSEIVSYFKENGELPFNYNGNNWSYDTVCERQKRRQIIRCQHLTPDKTARRIAEIAYEKSPDSAFALDACCGTGQLTGALAEKGYTVVAFDIDPEMIAVHHFLYPECNAQLNDFTGLSGAVRFDLIVSNPRFDAQIAIAFFQCLNKMMTVSGKAVLLLPKGFVDKTRPKALTEGLAKFRVLYREDMTEKFFHTAILGEIVVLEKKE